TKRRGICARAHRAGWRTRPRTWPSACCRAHCTSGTCTSTSSCPTAYSSTTAPARPGAATAMMLAVGVVVGWRVVAEADRGVEARPGQARQRRSREMLDALCRRVALEVELDDAGQERLDRRERGQRAGAPDREAPQRRGRELADRVDELAQPARRRVVQRD